MSVLRIVRLISALVVAGSALAACDSSNDGAERRGTARGPVVTVGARWRGCMAAHGVKLPEVKGRAFTERHLALALKKSPTARMRFAAALATPPPRVSADRYKLVLAACARAVRRTTRPGYLP
jgi:hypothetical protein